MLLVFLLNLYLSWHGLSGKELPRTFLFVRFDYSMYITWVYYLVYYLVYLDITCVNTDPAEGDYICPSY